MKKLTYRFPDDFTHSLSKAFVHALLENAPRLTNAIMERCESITRTKNAKHKATWEKRFGEKYPYRFEPSVSHLKDAIREAALDVQPAAFHE